MSNEKNSICSFTVFSNSGHQIKTRDTRLFVRLLVKCTVAGEKPTNRIFNTCNSCKLSKHEFNLCLTDRTSNNKLEKIEFDLGPSNETKVKRVFANQLGSKEYPDLLK